MAKIGTSSIPKHFFAQNGKVDVRTGLFLKSLSQNENGQIVAETRCGVVDTFDYALVSIPAPQLLNDVKLGQWVQIFFKPYLFKDQFFVSVVRINSFYGSEIIEKLNLCTEIILKHTQLV